jgi:transposase
MAVAHLSKEELNGLYSHGSDAVWDHLNELQNEHADFKRRLGLHSQNSSKPPSTDLAKKKKNNSREAGNRQSGGQKGHKGHTRDQVENPDEIIPCIPEACNCGHKFTGTEELLNSERRQIIDIPRPQLMVLEYQAQTYLCPGCSQQHKGPFPAEVKVPVQYGNNLQAYVVYLMNYQLLPYKRTADLLKNLHNLPISEGTLRNIQARFANHVEAPVEMIKQSLIDSKVVHFDESGLYALGQRHWLHVASNEAFTFYFHHKSRGFEALEQAGILHDFKGTACHDLWKTYYRYDGCDHSLCNAHHLRDLQGIIDSSDSTWAKEMKSFLKKTKIIIDNAKIKNTAELPQDVLLELKVEYQEIIDKGQAETPSPPERKPGQRGQLAKGKVRNLLERFDIRRGEIIDYIEDFNRPFDNNQAERDIRMVKVKQKISGTFRSAEMAQNFCTIRSYISTAIKQRVNVFDAISEAFAGKFFLFQ